MSFPKIIALCIIVGLGAYALLIYSRPLGEHEPQQTREAVTSPHAQTKETTLSFSPSSFILTSAQEKTIAVLINTRKNEISAAQLEISYDPSKIIITSIQPADFFHTPLQPVNTHDRGRGRIDFVMALPPNQPPVSGQGRLALITLTRNPVASQSATTEIGFLPKTAVRGEEQTSSLLKNTENAAIELEAIPPQP